jgi:hypothetical protein
MIYVSSIESRGQVFMYNRGKKMEEKARSNPTTKGKRERKAYP